MEMNSLVKNQFSGGPTVKIRHQYPRSFVVLLLMNILAIVFGCVIIVKLTGSTTKTEQLERDNQKLSSQLLDMIEGAHEMKAVINDLEKKMTAFLNISNEMNEMRIQLDKYQNLLLQIPKNISGTDERVLEVVKRTQAIEVANNAAEKKLTALPNLQDEMGKIHGRFDQDENLFLQLSNNVTGMDKRILDMVKHAQAMESAYNATEEKKMATLLNISNEMDKMRTQLDEHKNLFLQIPKNFSVTDERVLDVMKRTQAIEAANNAVEKKLTALTKIEDEMEKMRNRLHQDENRISQLAENVTTADQQVMDDVMKQTRAMKAAVNILEQQMPTLPNIQNEMGKMQGRLEQDENKFLQLAKNVTDTEKQILNMIERTQAIEAANDALKERVSEFLERTRTTGKAVWKFDNYNESMKQSTQDKSKIYYGPTFYTSQFGYKMQLTCVLKAKAIDIHIRVIRGEYDDLLKWPFNGKITFITFDQSQQKKDAITSFVDVSQKSSACWETWQKPSVNTGQTTPCGVVILSDNHLQSGNYIRNNTLFLGIEVESY